MSNILKIAASGVEAAPTEYQIERSLRFNSADTPYLSRSFSYSTRRKQTFSFWMKRSKTGATDYNAFGAYDGTANFSFRLTIASDQLLVRFGGATAIGITTTQVFRDVSAWQHICVVIDTTDATSTNRLKLYVNGEQVTSFSSASYPSQNADSQFGSNSSNNRIGVDYTNGFPFDGYLAEFYFIQDQALTPSDFGETDATTGVWKPKAYAGTYGTNGFYLDFSDNSSTTALGYDAAGSNDWTPNNFSVTAGNGNDSLVDTPTPYGTDTGAGGEVRGNYCTLNPLDSNGGTISNGNLNVVTATTGSGTTRGTIGVSSGKWYWEGVITSGTGGMQIGILANNVALPTYTGFTASGYAYSSAGNKENNSSGTAYGASYTTNDVIGVALDMDAGTIAFYKNGVSQGTAFSSLSGTFAPAVSDNSSTLSSTIVLNFGQRPFAYTAPSGFKALCTQNLPTPTVVDGNGYFNTVLYTGTGTSSNSITGVGFQPDLVWLKVRNTTGNHGLYDAVRGTSLQLISNSTAAEATNAGVSSLDSDGFSLGTSFNQTNNFVAWNWNAGGSNATNTDGTITSTVRANTTAGFSVVSYTGNSTANSTVGHGLGATPAMIIVKRRDATSDWKVSHSAYANTSLLNLHLTNALATSEGTRLQRTNSTVFTVGDAADYAPTNLSGATYIAFCFSEVTGYSKFSSYTGNGSSSGPFVYTGFRPAFVLVKATSRTGNWGLWDTKRNSFNVSSKRLSPNDSAAELDQAATSIDIYSNGFRPLNSDYDMNENNATYIFMAFATSPFKYSLAR